ncbi:MAG: tRNA (adenosine(37)-N6)-threonylcarbamoyltransferase complex dimerization subunit type 1 TsaB [Spirochaetota bacterium]
MTITVETSTRAFSVALFDLSEIASFSLQSQHASSQHLVDVVNFILNKLKVSIHSIKEAFAGIGPGSFTGVRIGLSFVNTLFQTLNIPILGVSSLDILAFKGGRGYNSVIPFIKSRRDEAYTAFYRDGQRQSDYRVLSSGELLQFIEERNPRRVIASEEDFSDILGESSLKQGDVVRFEYPDARSLYELVRNCGLKAEFRYLRPLYLRCL